MGRQSHRFHGAPERFDVVARFIAGQFRDGVHYIADVAGGQGKLSRILEKKYNYNCEVIDPRGHCLRGIKSRQELFDPGCADYYDLLVGLHPDEALRPLAEAALLRPVILIPCCNFWSDEKLGREPLLSEIESFYHKRSVRSRRIVLKFAGPHNIGLVSRPPKRRASPNALP